MANYIPTDWKDEIVDGAGNVVQKGTPLSAANLKKLEAGVEGAVAAVDGKADGEDFDQFKAATTTQLADTANNTEQFMAIGNVTPKAVYNEGGHYFVITQKPNGNGYVRFRLRDGIVTSDSSVGGSAELLRVVEVLNVLDCFSLQFAETSNSDGAKWNTLTNSTINGVTVPFRRNSVNGAVGDWIEYSIDVPSGVNYIEVLTFSTSGGSKNAKISVDGVDVLANVSLYNAGSVHGRVAIPITPGNHKIRITSVESGFISICGMNVIDLKNYKKGFSFDKIVTIHQGSANQYVTNAGSMDYAMVDADTGLYCGSYHGGETKSRLAFVLDGKTVDLSSGTSLIGNVFEVEQDTRIVDKINSFSRQIFKQDGSRELELYFEGDINLRKLFTNMSTTHSSFKDILYPKRQKVTTDGAYYLNQDCNYVIQRNPINNQKVITVMNNNVLPAGRKITPYVQAVDAYGYNKLYKLNIDSGTAVNFKGGSFRTVHIFE